MRALLPVKKRKPTSTAKRHRPSAADGYLFFREYIVQDPFDQTLREAARALWAATYPGAYGAPNPVEVSLTRPQALRLLSTFEAWEHFAGHPADDESILKQLREVRRFARKVHK